MEANNVQLAVNRGEFFERWYAAMHDRFEHPRRLDASVAGE